MNVGIGKSKHRIVGFKYASLTALALVLSGQAFAAQVAPSSLSVSPGTSNGAITALAQGNEGKVVNLYSNRKGNLAVAFKFSASGLSSSLSLAGRLRQHSAKDIFTFQSLDASGKWVAVGSSTGGTTYKNIAVALPSNAVVGGVISVRLVSNSGANDLDLDQLVIASSDSTGVPAPPTSPSPSPTPTPTPPPVVLPPTSPAATGAIPAGTKWYWQLTGTINMNVQSKVYDIDAYDNTAETFAALRASGHKVICYFSAGTYEDWRSDASLFPSSALGNKVSGWAGEKWLDVRNSEVRAIMAKRMDVAKAKGCDGLEPDNVDGYANNSGFPLTSADQVNFDTFLADQAHARGMVVALKNTTDLVRSLVNKFDFAVVEECFKYNECDMYAPFIAQNKAVFNAEYTTYSATTCTKAANLGFSTVFYNLNLDGQKYQPCP